MVNNETGKVSCGGPSLSHPLVYMEFDEDGQATCPYCGAHYNQSEKSALRADDAQADARTSLN